MVLFWGLATASPQIPYGGMMRRFLLYMAVLGLLLFLVPSSALASRGLTVGHMGGKGINPEVLPGESYVQTLVVSIGKDDPPTDVLIEALGYRDGDTGVEAVLPEADNSPYSARMFIQPAKVMLHVEPGETKQVDVTVTIPANVGSGGRYAILRFSTVPPEQGTITIVSAIVLPVKFTIKDSQLIHSGEVTGVAIGKAVSGQPIEIFTSFRNTGNHHFKIEGQIEIRDASDKHIDTIHITTSSPIPDGTKRIKTIYIPQAELPLGVYSVKSRLMLEDGTLLDEASGSFEVEEPYVPPPPPASVTVSPSSASILKTEDDKISVTFPHGAVISQVEVSLRSYLLEQLPPPPTGFDVATTCFRIDGLTGLLAKEATVTVEYSAADLDKADGDASRLRLARWDEAQSQWSVLKTKVDKEAMTLTTNTNQLSIWAVVVAPPAHPQVNWPLIGGIVGGVIVTALSVYFVTVRRRGGSTG
jgi:hypothetical protein